MSVETVVEFINTLDLELGEELFTDATVLGRWLNTKGLIGRDERITSEEDLALVLRTREALRRVLACRHDGCDPPVDALMILEEAGDAADYSLSYGPDGSSALQARAKGVAGALGWILAESHAAELTDDWERVKVCANDGCQWAFYDSSRNQSRRWCRMEICGNRAKVRAHRSRQSG